MINLVELARQQHNIEVKQHIEKLKSDINKTIEGFKNDIRNSNKS